MTIWWLIEGTDCLRYFVLLRYKLKTCPKFHLRFTQLGYCVIMYTLNVISYGKCHNIRVSFSLYLLWLTKEKMYMCKFSREIIRQFTFP